MSDYLRVSKDLADMELHYIRVRDERDKLRAEMERLRDGIRKHRLEVLGDPLPCQMVPHDDEFKADHELWALIETESGGAGE